jgi:hypothetical protein
MASSGSAVTKGTTGQRQIMGRSEATTIISAARDSSVGLIDRPNWLTDDRIARAYETIGSNSRREGISMRNFQQREGMPVTFNSRGLPIRGADD